MGEMGSTFYLVVSAIVAVMAVVCGLGAWVQLRSMIALPNTRLIQINIDCRFIPLSIKAGFAILLASTTLYGIQQSRENAFLENAEASEKGMIGTKFLIEKLAAGNDEKCTHVHRVDGNPLVIAIDARSQPNVICGVSRDQLTKKMMVPFVKIGDEYHVLIGDWPFSYALAYADIPTHQ